MLEKYRHTAVVYSCPWPCERFHFFCPKSFPTARECAANITLYLFICLIFLVFFFEPPPCPTNAGPRPRVNVSDATDAAERRALGRASESAAEFCREDLQFRYSLRALEQHAPCPWPTRRGGGRVGSQGVGGHEMVRWQLVSPRIPFGVEKQPYPLFHEEISCPGKCGTQL